MTAAIIEDVKIDNCDPLEVDVTSRTRRLDNRRSPDRATRLDGALIPSSID